MKKFMQGLAAGTPFSVKNGKRILFASVPADGHVNPLTSLAIHLLQMGYDVRWYTSARYEKKINKLGIPFYPLKKAVDIGCGSASGMMQERDRIHSHIDKVNFDLINVFILRSTEYFEDIKEIHESFPFDLMVADCLFSAIPFVKEKMNVPVISVGVIPLIESSEELAPVGLGMTPAKSFWGKRRQDVLRFLAKDILFRKADRLLKNILRENGIQYNNGYLFDVLIDKSSLFLQSGVPGFEYTRKDLNKKVRFIGPLLPHEPDEYRTPWFDDRLNQFEKVIMVTQGTVEKNIEKIIVPTLEAFKNSDTLVICSTGGSKTNELKSRFPQHNLIIDDFIPFGDVMPYLDAYVSNGGYGGVLMAIEHGLPMVVAGTLEGKSEINARVGFFNLGINLKTEKPSAAQMKKAVNEVISNQSYKKNVIRMGKEFDTYCPASLCAAYVRRLIDNQPMSASCILHSLHHN